MPTRVVASSEDRLLPAEFQQQVALERLGTTPTRFLGGHLVALAQPAPLADRLEAYALEAVGSTWRPLAQLQRHTMVGATRKV